MFYVYQSEYGYTVAVRTNSNATSADIWFAHKSGYFPNEKEAYSYIAKHYP